MTAAIPPLGGFAPSRVCSRLINGKGCGKPGVAHVIWTTDLQNGSVCQQHLAELGHLWDYRWVHDLGPDCGMPGSHFDPHTNTCFYPGDSVPTLDVPLEAHVA